MNEMLNLLPALIMGILLGAIFFGGLWWTVRNGVWSEQPATWFFVSMLLRTGITLAGFYFVSADHWERLPVCLLGFLIARFIVMRLTRAAEKSAYPAQEISHAPQPR